ncbi:unnamed protein product [Cuscuta campestris]|uniref:Retrotransposon gag domain-containing protein n=1 Tax=Cuscuta campestris TaxID=132261 RepID=A0A484LBK7_9ASTE|nr:unnamed protein product [Cuscuta campestris]
MSQAAGNDGQAVPHGEPEHVSMHTEASSFTPQQALEQAAPGAGPVLGVVPINQPQFAANFMNFLQQLVGAYVPPPPPPPPPVAVVTIEKLWKNGAEEFLGDQIADPMIAKRWFERTIRVLGNLRVPQDQRGDLAVALLQDSAYDWWKRVGADVPEPMQWATFDRLFHEEYIPEHFVEAKREEFLKFTQGKLTLPEYRQKFDELAEFGQDLVPTMEKRCKRFVEGLRPDISAHLITAPRMCKIDLAHQFLMGLNDAYYGILQSNLLAQNLVPPVGRIYNKLVQDGTTQNSMHKRRRNMDILRAGSFEIRVGEEEEATMTVPAVQDKETDGRPRVLDGRPPVEVVVEHKPCRGFSQPNYKKWSRLFLLLARRFNLHYLDGSIVPISDDDDEWFQLDAILQGWILSTITDEVSDLVISSVSTASALWKMIHDLFHDNKHARAMQLEHQFRTTVKGSTPMATYCQELRNIADWLDDVDAPVSEHQLILQMLHGLPDDLQAQTSFLQFQDPMSSFLQVRSALLLLDRQRTPLGSTSSTALLAEHGGSGYTGGQHSGNGGRGSGSNFGSEGHFFGSNYGDGSFSG